MLTQNLLLAGDDAYNLTKSLRFRASASAYMTRTVSSGTSSTKGTLSLWVKRGKDWDSNNNGSFIVAADGYNYGQFFNQTLYFGNTTSWINTAAVYRDYASWYHVVFVFDTTLSTSTDRLQIWVNGVRQTAGNTVSYPTQNASFPFLNSAQGWYIGGRFLNSDQFFDGYLTDINYVDGQALTPSSFGSTNALTGVWQPAKYTGTYGTNGFYLPFTNTTSTTTLGYDFSGNSNNWTTNNISLTAGTTYDSMNDVPTLTSATTANTATINPLDYVNSNTGSLTAANGNLLVTRSTTAYGGFPATMALPSSGKFVFEFTASQAFNGSTNEAYFGIGVQSNGTFTNSSATGYVGDYYTGVNVTGSSGSIQKKVSGGSITTPYSGGAVGSGDVFQFLVDMTNGTVDIKKNGSAYGSQVTGLPNTLGLYPYISLYGSVSMSANFGQQPFASTPTSGFVALNTFNLPTSTIVKGNTVMDATTYTGNGSTQSITNAGATKPDLVWVKSRSSATYNELYDSVRGVSKRLFSNDTAAEADFSPYGVTAFNSNGFTVNDVTSSGYGVNESGVSYVGWQWQAGQGSSSSNTNGSITSTVSVNASAGFSVVTYTGNGTSGATFGHGLGVTPSMIIIKNRGTSAAWAVNHASIGATQYLNLNTTGAVATDTTVFQNRSSTTVTLGTDGWVNGNTMTYVAYCWSEIAGFSKFGSYTGNGSADGTFVYTGFRPKYIMFKGTSAGYSWGIMDSARGTINVINNPLVAEGSNAELSGLDVDFLSNGFKFRSSNSSSNGSGITFIYMAFAENPTKFALAR